MLDRHVGVGRIGALARCQQRKFRRTVGQQIGPAEPRITRFLSSSGCGCRLLTSDVRLFDDMKDSAESRSEERRPRRLQLQPDILALGRNYVGAKIRGSFQVLPANSAEPICCRSCGPDACTRQPVPDWLELDGPYATPQEGLAWQWAIRTEKAGERLASLAIDCDTGTSGCQISLVLQDGEPSLGDIVFCQSPFSCWATGAEISALVRVLTGFDCRVHYVDGVKDIGGTRPRGIVLHGGGLLRAGPDERDMLDQLVREGTNLVVFADEFYRGTTTAGNALLSSCDMEFLSDGTDDPAMTREEKIRRISDWQQKYTDARCLEQDIFTDALTSGVRRLHWFRPCPLLLKGSGSSPLVKHPSEPEKFLAAVSRRRGAVVAVGTSLVSSLARVGWPYDNDRLLANLLVGGDAEALMTIK